MKRLKIGIISTVVILLVVLISLFYGNQKRLEASKKDPILNKETEELLELEARKSFDFFWDEANTDEESPGYGLIHDRAPGAPGIASIASVGFGLSAYVIGVERDWVTHDEAYARTLRTLNTLLDHAQHVNGHFYHFLHMETGRRAWNSEASVIDTAIAVNGAIVAGEYFGGEIKEKAQQLYERVDWEWYRDPERNMFYMGYSPERGFEGHWDFYAEQLMMYFLGAASPTYPTNSEMFYDFQRRIGSYGSYPEFIYSWHGSIFTYQFSHAWFDLRHLEDKEDVDWFRNSIIASLTNRKYSIDNESLFKTLGKNSWGMTASDGPDGYHGHYGAMPNGYNNDANYLDGTVPPAGAAGSIVFTPQESVDALMNYYKNYPELWGVYGFKDAYNLDVKPEWYAPDVIGINKGITLLMIENYRTGFIWELFMKNEYVQSGIRKVGLTPLEALVIDDFEGNQFHSGWTADSSKELQISTEQAFTGLNSLKASVDQSFHISLIDWNEKQKYNVLRLKVYGQAKISIVLHDEDGQELMQKDFDLKKADNWNNIDWDLSNETDLIEKIDKVQFHVSAKGNKSNFIYLDDIEFIQNKPAAHHVVISGDPYVGEELTGSYIFYDSYGDDEGNSSYQWFISDTAKGEFIPIEGETSKTYIVKQADVDKFIKFEVVPKTKAKGALFNKESRKGEKAQSEFLPKVKRQ